LESDWLIVRPGHNSRICDSIVAQQDKSTNASLPLGITTPNSNSVLLGYTNLASFCDYKYRHRYTIVWLVKTVHAAKFKEQCLALLDSVDPDGIIITKHGKPVAKLIPVHTDSAKLIGSFKGKIKIKGNILTTGVKWDAES
jgi:prevent-host-death family protein